MTDVFGADPGDDLGDELGDLRADAGRVVVGRAARGRRRALVVVAALLAGAVATALWPSGPGEDDTGAEGAGTPVTYEVRSGQSVRSVGDELAELGVIDSTLRFRRVAEEVGLAAVLRPGRFALVTGMTEEEAVATLAAGPVEGLRRPSVRIQVIEGLLLADTLAALDEQLDHVTLAELEAVIEATRTGADGGLTLPDWWPDVTTAPDGVDLLEGVLWPQTYDVFTDAAPRDVLQRLVDQTVSEMARIADGDLEVLGRVRTRHELMTIASLVERETNVDSERPLVSGVIHGRLADGMRLEIDATLSYAKGDLTAIPLDVDRASDSPYNTYRITGLTPGPISGVGRASLEAAASPEETTFRFYVLAPACDGSHVFAVTFAEHSRNVTAFRAARDAGACR
jgi:UPF0755 protein